MAIAASAASDSKIAISSRGTTCVLAGRDTSSAPTASSRPMNDESSASARRATIRGVATMSGRADVDGPDQGLVHRLAGDGAVPLDGLLEQVEFLLRDRRGRQLREPQHQFELLVGVDERQRAALGAHDADGRPQDGGQHFGQHGRAVQLTRDVEQLLQVPHAGAAVVEAGRLEQRRDGLAHHLELHLPAEPHAVAVAEDVRGDALVVDVGADGAAEVLEHEGVFAARQLGVAT